MNGIPKHGQYDVAVVGAGVAGTTAAILLRQAGLSVLLVDQRVSVGDYKRLCTHFVQPCANGVFADMGLDHLLGPDFSVRTKAAFHVPGGVIDTEDGYDPQGSNLYAHNLERSVMDPELRARAIGLGVDLVMGAEVTALAEDAVGQRLTFSSGASVPVGLIVAADGRASRLARLTGAETRSLPNDRIAFFCYCSGIAAPDRNRSIFVLRNSEMSFLYPLIRNRTLLSVYIVAERAEGWTGDEKWPRLLAQFRAHLPGIDFSRAAPETQVYSYRRYENQIRPPVTGGVAFVGDAAVSIDPMSGVGCSFALKSARLLADAVLANRDDRDAALAAYAAAHRAFFDPHIQGIAADSRVSKTDDSVAATYAPILKNQKLQRQFLDLTARLIKPSDFQQTYMMAVALGAQRKQPVGHSAVAAT